MHVLLRFAGVVAAIALTVHLVPGITISGGWATTLLVALVWSIITLVIRPVLRILTLPITLLTFGLFALVLNALLFWAMAFIVPGFFVDGFLSALLGAIVISIITWFVDKIF